MFYLQCLQDLIIELLTTAAKSDFKSIAIPAIGTGYLRFPHQVVAQTMYNTVAEYFSKNPQTSLDNVVFVIYKGDDNAVQVG